MSNPFSVNRALLRMDFSVAGLGLLCAFFPLIPVLSSETRAAMSALTCLCLPWLMGGYIVISRLHFISIITSRRFREPLMLALESADSYLQLFMHAHQHLVFLIAPFVVSLLVTLPFAISAYWGMLDGILSLMLLFAFLPAGMFAYSAAFILLFRIATEKCRTKQIKYVSLVIEEIWPLLVFHGLLVGVRLSGFAEYLFAAGGIAFAFFMLVVLSNLRMRLAKVALEFNIVYLRRQLAPDTPE